MLGEAARRKTMVDKKFIAEVFLSVEFLLKVRKLENTVTMKGWCKCRKGIGSREDVLTGWRARYCMLYGKTCMNRNHRDGKTGVL